jgi:hypothetical protein
MLRFAFAGTFALVLLLPAGTAPARAADADTGVKEIVARAIKAKGGAANIEKYKAVTSSFTGTLSLPDAKAEMSGTSKDQAPDKTRLDAVVHIDGRDATVVQIFDGKRGWHGDKDKLQEMDEATADEAREQVYADQLIKLRSLNAPGVRLTALGESKVDDKPAVGLRASSEGHRDIRLFFGKDDGLLLKSEWTGKDPETRKEFKSEAFFSDYKDVSGLKMPHKLKVLRDGAPLLETQITKMTLSESLPDKDFTKP